MYIFDYILLCNKICGASHYDMQMTFVVETKDQFNDWMKSEEAKKKKNEEAKKNT